MERTQMNHIFASFIAFVKLEGLKVRNNLNHFALKNKIYIAAIKKAKQEIRTLQSNNKENSSLQFTLQLD